MYILWTQASIYVLEDSKRFLSWYLVVAMYMLFWYLGKSLFEGAVLLDSYSPVFGSFQQFLLLKVYASPRGSMYPCGIYIDPKVMVW